MIDIIDVASIAVFEGLSEDEVEDVVRCGEVELFDSGEVVIQESKVSSDLYLLLKGRASVEIEIEAYNQRRRERLVILREGDAFGEIAFLNGKRRSAFVVAYDSIQVLRLDSDKMYALFELQSRIGYVMMMNLAGVLAQRLRDTNFRWRREASETDSALLLSRRSKSKLSA